MLTYVAGILNHSNVNGDGMRTVVFFSKCSLNCPGCHNKEFQKLETGTKMDTKEIMDIVIKNNALNDGVTFSGGDPFEQPDAFIECLKHCKANHINVWVYTGRTYEQLISNPLWESCLEYIDVLVDGPYIESLKSETTKYRGSSNQRLLYLEKGKIKKVH